MKKLENKIMLITYPDSMGRNLIELRQILKDVIGEAVGGVHLLPFFPSSGDRGFAPMTYRQVDKSFGGWRDIEALSRDYYLMFDYMINHISARSEYYQDFLEHKDASPYQDLFLRYRNFWEGGEPTKRQVDAIYKRKPRAPYVTARFRDGSEEKVWCTFDEEQIDIDVRTDTAKRFIQENLAFLAQKGAAVIRLDAFAYATKKAGTSCFFLEPQVWELLQSCEEILKPYGTQLLPEIHEHYQIQMKIADRGHWIYDFALPMMLLHAVYSGQTRYLKHWLDISPRKQFTTLDTHDGIGVVDVRDLLPEAEIHRTREQIYRCGANVKKIYSTAAYQNLDIYQINCTYYSALGNRDDAYLLARAVQFFAPGIPQVYYVGLLAGKNDIELLEMTKVGRDINRHYYTKSEVEQEARRPVVAFLMQMMRLRNRHRAFDLDSAFIMPDCGEDKLVIQREKTGAYARLEADFSAMKFTIRYSGETGEECLLTI